MLGYFMFWGRISDVYLGVITLTVSLIFFRFINQTAGEQWNIGDAPLGGFNGIPATPILNWPGRPGEQLAPENIFSLAVGLLIIVYFSCKILLATRFGRIIVAIRENETRATAIGYPVYRYKLVCFVISGAIAGLAGALIANQTSYVGPALLHWVQSGTLMVMVILGGVGRFWGGPVGAAVLLSLEELFSGSPLLGPFALHWQLPVGAILLAVVLFAPRGIAGAFAKKPQ
jgi:branched-chain amino acid transport system permease protein